MSSSRMTAFYRLPVEERRRRLAETLGFGAAETEALSVADALPVEVADIMIENAVGTFALPLGVALNFRVNGREHVIPMVVEEPSVIARLNETAATPNAVERSSNAAAPDLPPMRWYSAPMNG